MAVRRVDITRKSESLLDYIDTSRIFLLPNTAACYTADEAIRTAQLGREAGLSNWVKLEVIGDEKTLFPDTAALLEATRVLVKDGFVVLPYTNDDPVVCRKLEDAGRRGGDAARRADRLGLSASRTPTTSASSASSRASSASSRGAGHRRRRRRAPRRMRRVAMELGADGVLMNTAIAGAADPVAMARAMKLAVEAGRLAFRAGRIRGRCTRRPAVRSKGSSAGEGRPHGLRSGPGAAEDRSGTRPTVDTTRR